jgi:hypothetical protein
MQECETTNPADVSLNKKPVDPALHQVREEWMPGKSAA